MMRREDGVTLVELLVGILLTAIVGSAIMTLTISVQRTQAVASEIRADIDQARAATELLRKDLRQARQVYTRAGKDSAYWLEFWVDANQNRIEDAGERWFYEIDGDTLHRWSGVASPRPDHSRLAGRLVAGSAFSYDPSVADAQLVTLTLSVAGSSSVAPDAHTIRTTVRTRNVR